MFRWLWRIFTYSPGQFDLYPARGRMRALRVRAYTSDDFEACRQLYILNEPGRFPPGVLPEFETSLRSGSALYLVAEKEGEICGCGGVSRDPRTTGLARLFFALVHPNHHRRGIGTALLLSRIAVLRDGHWVVTLSTVPSSASFYERFNFCEMGRGKLATGEEVLVRYVRVSPTALYAASDLLTEAGVEFLAHSAIVPHSKQ